VSAELECSLAVTADPWELPWRSINTTLIVVRDAHTCMHPGYYASQPVSTIPRYSELDAKRRLTTIVHCTSEFSLQQNKSFPGGTHRQLMLRHYRQTSGKNEGCFVWVLQLNIRSTQASAIEMRKHLSILLDLYVKADVLIREEANDRPAAGVDPKL
jgi:hypothetical protein